jgi:hypothetical protein
MKWLVNCVSIGILLFINFYKAAEFECKLQIL